MGSFYRLLPLYDSPPESFYLERPAETRTAFFSSSNMFNTGRVRAPPRSIYTFPLRSLIKSTVFVRSYGRAVFLRWNRSACGFAIKIALEDSLRGSVGSSLSLVPLRSLSVRRVLLHRATSLMSLVSLSPVVPTVPTLVSLALRPFAHSNGTERPPPKRSCAHPVSPDCQRLLACQSPVVSSLANDFFPQK